MSLFLPTKEPRSVTLENPATPLSDPDNVLFDAAGGPSASGVRVNRTSAMKLSAFWRGVDLISSDAGKLPCFVYKRTSGGKERDPEHPAYKLCRHEANREMTAMVQRKTLLVHALTVGNGYAFIVREGARPTEIIPLNPETTFPVRENGRLWIITTVNGQMRKLEPSDVIHIQRLGWDGITGFSTVQFGRDSLGRGLAIQDYSGRFFMNNARPTTVLTHPTHLSEDAQKNLKKSWRRMYSGLENQHLTAVLEEGMDIKTLSDNAKDSQLIQSEAHSIRDVANWLGVPPHKVGDTTRTSRSSLEEENQSYLDEGLDVWLVAIEEEYRSKLLTEEEKNSDSHFIEFRREALVRANLQARGDFYAKALGGAPWMVQDEVRNIENLNKFPDGEGEKVLIPLNIGQQTGGEPNPVPVEDDDEEDARTALIVESNLRVMRDGISRISKRIASKARRAARKPDGFCDWIDKVCDDEREAFRDAVMPPLQAICLARGQDALEEHETQATIYFDGIVRGCFLGAADAKPEGLVESVGKAIESLYGYWADLT